MKKVTIKNLVVCHHRRPWESVSHLGGRCLSCVEDGESGVVIIVVVVVVDDVGGLLGARRYRGRGGSVAENVDVRDGS